MENMLLIWKLVLEFLYGIVIGSFLNVCIYRIPKEESVAKERSHCMNCGYQLRWYDLIPIFSYVCLKGKCRKCGEKISIQYPLIEGLNGILYVLVFTINGTNFMSVIYCLLVSALIVLSVIDFRTYEIPINVNIFILVLGIGATALDYKNFLVHIIGFFTISGFLYIIYYASKGRAFGGGDVKLMAVAGLVLGWKLIILAFFAGCIIGSVIHMIRMRVSEEGHMLAMGPYLSIGIFISMLYGTQLIKWYLSFL